MQNKYDKEDVNVKKHAVSKIFHYKMTDNKLMVEKAQDFITIIGEFCLKKIKIKDNILVCDIIDELPPL